jgi:phosphoserine aminotransferase
MPQVIAGSCRQRPGSTIWPQVPETRSNTSVCLKIVDPDILALDGDAQAAFAKAIAKRLEKEGVALDIAGYRDAPAGLRIWAGGTVEAGRYGSADALARLGV